MSPHTVTAKSKMAIWLSDHNNSIISKSFVLYM
jgi:hypothetical protein